MKKLFALLLCCAIVFTVGCSATKKDYKSYVGVWRNGDSSIPDDELIIDSIEDDKITFDYIVYKTASYENEVATLDGDTATFNIDGSIKGTITLKDNKVTFTVSESSFEYISAGSTTYTNKYDKSLLKGE